MGNILEQKSFLLRSWQILFRAIRFFSCPPTFLKEKSFGQKCLEMREKGVSERGLDFFIRRQPTTERKSSGMSDGQANDT